MDKLSRFPPVFPWRRPVRLKGRWWWQNAERRQARERPDARPALAPKALRRGKRSRAKARVNRTRDGGRHGRKRAPLARQRRGLARQRRSRARRRRNASVRPRQRDVFPPPREVFPPPREVLRRTSRGPRDRTGRPGHRHHGPNRSRSRANGVNCATTRPYPEHHPA